MATNRLSIWAGYAFVVVLFVSAAAVSLPNADAPNALLIDFYSLHGSLVLAMQLLGLLASMLLIIFALRVRQSDNTLGTTLLVTALAGTLPAYPIIAIALLAPSGSNALATLNQLSSLADNILFLCITVFASVVAQKHTGWSRWGAALVALLALGRSLLGFMNTASPLDVLAPLAFLVLIVAIATQLLYAETQTSTVSR